MKIELFSVKDTLVGFSQPFAAMSDAVALRQFIATVQSPKPNFCNTFPEQKELYYIGCFDDATGKITTSDELPRFLANASAYVLSAEQTKNLDKEEKKDDV